MALEKGALKLAIQTALEKNITGSGEAIDKAKRQTEILANDLADAIDAFIKSATVTVIAESGKIQVEGTPAKQANITPITITGDPNGVIKGGLS